jgi:dTDP-4-amino-4,6-dideoxygalactose transaminase
MNDTGNNQARPVAPMSSPDLTEDERQAVADVLKTPRLSMGPQSEAFEAEVAGYVGARFGVAVNSGTAGLHLCVRAAGITDGDLVLTTPFSFVASSNVLLYERAVPVFVDVDPKTGNTDPELVQQAAKDLASGGSAAERWLPRKGVPSSGRLKALLPVDVFGQPPEFDALNDIASHYDLRVIEDSCEAIGATYRDRPAGTLGDAGVFAFYPNKQLTTGEGGVIVTDREDWAQACRALRNQGRSVGDTWLAHSVLGYNYRLPEISAALGRAQMKRLDQLLLRRDQVANWYRAALGPVEGVELPQIAATTTRMSWFVYVIRLRPGLDRDRVAARLEDAGVPTRPYFPPIHLQPYFVDRFGYRPGDFPVTEDLGARGLALPFSGVMTQDQVAQVAEALSMAIDAG